MAVNARLQKSSSRILIFNDSALFSQVRIGAASILPNVNHYSGISDVVS